MQQLIKQTIPWEIDTRPGSSAASKPRDGWTSKKGGEQAMTVRVGRFTTAINLLGDFLT